LLANFSKNQNALTSTVHALLYGGVTPTKPARKASNAWEKREWEELARNG